MRVAHVISTPAGIGGAERTLSDLVACGAGMGWEQLVLNPFAIDPHVVTIRDLYAPAAYEGRPYSSWRGLVGLRRWLSRQLAGFRPDIVHAHLFHASVMVASLRLGAHVPTILSHQHGDKFQVSGARVLERIDRLAGRRFDQVVGCSQSVADYLLYRYGYSPARVSYVHNGWSGSPLPRSDDPARRRVICVAHLSAQKNHHLLIDAIARVRTRVPAVSLRLVGDGSARTELETHVERLGLGESVEFLGRVDDVWPLLAQSEVFVLPSVYEPLGIAALEAMAAGLPVVATAVGGLREIVRDGTTGYLVPANDEVALAARLIELLEEPQLRNSMGLRGRALAEDHRSDRMAQGYARVYDRLLAARAAGDAL